MIKCHNVKFIKVWLVTSLWVTILIIGLGNQGVAGAKHEIIWPKIQTVTSALGIKAWLIEDHNAPMISVSLRLRGAGSVADPPGREGLAHFMATTLDEGAGNQDSATVRRLLSDNSITMSFSADRERFTGTLLFLSYYQTQAVELFQQALMAPRFDQEPVDRVRQQILTTLKSQQASPDEQAELALFQSLFGTSGYSHAPEGTLESVSKISPDDLRQFAKSHIGKDRLIIGLAGDLTPDQAAMLLDQLFGNLPLLGTNSDELKPSPHYSLIGDKDEVKKISLAVPQARLVSVKPAVSINDPRYFAAQILNYLYGGGSFESYLVDEIRRKRGLAYSASSYIYPLENAPMLIVNVASSASKLAELSSLLPKLQQNMQDFPFSDAQIEAAKANLIGSYLLGFASTPHVSARLAALQDYGFSPDYLSQRAKNYQSVTKEALKTLAKGLFSNPQQQTIIVGP